MNCSICQGVIEPSKDANGNIYWRGGNNAEPINTGRCCNACNELHVIPARLKEYDLQVDIDSLEKVDNLKPKLNK